MSIEWEVFTPLSSFSGGLLIGATAVLLMLVYGRIAGISGIVGGLLHLRRADFLWRAAFVAGIVISPVFFVWLAPLPHIQIDADFVTLIFAGLLVGFGARLGSGCTSGHSVCGLSRLSVRSLVATLIFMTTAFLTSNFLH